MAIRQQTVTDPAPGGRTQSMTAVHIKDDGSVTAHWVLTKRDGTTREVDVEITPALNTALASRAAFQTFLDNVRDDTFPRTGA